MRVLSPPWTPQVPRHDLFFPGIAYRPCVSPVLAPSPYAPSLSSSHRPIGALNRQSDDTGEEAGVDSNFPQLFGNIASFLVGGALASSALLWSSTSPLTSFSSSPSVSRDTEISNGRMVTGSRWEYGSLKNEEGSIIRLFKRNTPSVVFITNLASRRDAVTMSSFDVPQGAGSGIVWDNKGHIVTNFHVVRDATEVRVTLTDGREFPAVLVGSDMDRDVAVLQVDPSDFEQMNLQPVDLGSSSGLEVGQMVFAIGNPFGLDHTLTTGIISGIGREIINGNNGRPIQDVIQTDAAINPGNSGGPLLDSSGRLIGINTAIYSPSGANSGVGFAIPVDPVRSSVEQIIEFGRAVRPMIGIRFAPDGSIEQLGLSGILVLDTKEDSPAAKSGIKGTMRDESGRTVLGDVILAVDGKKVRTSSDLFRILDKKTVGDSLDLELMRGSVVQHVSITLEPSVS